MKNFQLVDSMIIDLKVAEELANLIHHDDLKGYVENRFREIEESKDLYEQIDISLLVDSYVIDLVLFIHASSLTDEIESKDYFKGRLMDLMKCFPDLKVREDLMDLF